MDVIQILMRVTQLDQLYQIRRLRFHALHGDRHGQYGLRLAGAWRLVVLHYPEQDELFVVEVKDYH